MRKMIVLFFILGASIATASCVDSGCPVGSEEVDGKCVDAAPLDAGQQSRGIEGGRGATAAPGTGGSDTGGSGAGGSGTGGSGTGGSGPAVGCEPLANPMQGSAVADGTAVGDVARYSCNEGFGLVGVASRTCQSDGTWSDEAPRCAAGDCPSLTSPEHGTATTAQGTAVGAIAQFSCEEGYQLVGEPQRSCQADKTWSGDDPQCAAADCGAPPPPDHGTVDTAAGTKLGAIAEYGCDTGYGLVGSASRTCQADGAWSGDAPTCALGACPNLTRPENGTLTTPTGTVVGAVATFDCISGYRRVGAMTSTCRDDHTWSAAPPVCEIVTCPALSDPANGTVTRPATLSYGETASYACKPGFYLSGALTRTCQANGSWLPAEPSCPDANTEGLRLQQLHIGGTSEFLVLKNTGSSMATLKGLRLELRDVGTTYALDFGDGTVAAGASTRVGEGSIDIALPMNLAGARAAAVLLCTTDPCSASNVIDAFTYEGEDVAPALPAGITVNAPVHGINSGNEDEEDFFRVAYDGSAPTFSSCDWSAAQKPPIFVESFECGDGRWSTYGGTWVLDTSGSGDGSTTALSYTGASGTGQQAKVFVFPEAVFPTHIDFWMYGFNRLTFSTSTDTATSAGNLGFAGFWNSPNSVAWWGAEPKGLQVGRVQWNHFELDNIDWNTGAFILVINGTRVSGDDPPRFNSSWVPGTGLRSVGIAGGIVDGIRMW